MNEIKQITVLGGGLMGSGIANVCATGGYKVVIREVSPELGAKAIEGIRKLLADRLERGKISKEAFDGTMGNLSAVVDLAEAVRNADLVIEAVPEDLNIKQKVLADVEEVARPETIFCSNTSAISITSIASKAKRKQNVIGTHFFFPAPVMRLVEISRTPNNSQELVDGVVAMCKRIGKFPVVINDSPGFVSARGMGHLKQAVSIWAQGLAEAATIDRIDRGFGHPMGPLEMMDMSGLDTFVHVFDYCYEEFGREDMKCPLAMRLMYRRGEIGRKTGKGFYDYSQKPAPPAEAPATPFKKVAIVTNHPDGSVSTLMSKAGVEVVKGPLSDLSKLTAGADLVVDVVSLSASAAERAAVLQQIEKVCGSSTIIATVSHCQSIASYTRNCARRERIIGLNYINPDAPNAMVEVPCTSFTSEETKSAVAAALRAAGADPVLVKDMPGFVSARIELPLIREAIIMVQDNVASAKAIEDIYVNGFNNPRGPLAAGDAMGLDRLLSELDYLYDSYKAAEFAAPGLLRQMVDEGKLGKKSGEGFLKY